MQFHPEVLTPQVARWAANDRPALLSSGADPDTALASLRAVEPQLRSIWGRTARAWGAVVRAAADPRTPEASDPDARRPSSSHAADAIRPLSCPAAARSSAT
ncbi:hypothetical protein ACFQZC_25570 [Streptacidiphilus monticola]